MSVPVQMEFEFQSVSSVLYKAKQETETYDPAKWDWVEVEVWTKRMLATLVKGVFAERGLFTMHKAYVSACRSR
jgi:hypothetical protein